ncbi:Eco57I restriction-modification methylase domain-containing protein [Fonticella tunisiensis]|uniref:site-specific DNA-methyltransferase (adenine-specific) n=1 Tax=Fonticella tunisiensis TaxID=1096341 RepID=A0A4R7KB98_9CLOT|nr:N-6 DNA methylase [Fonticella tunisiensis]TDT50806.1 adenine-specific DNA-methyltransferase [Fonticella tunisiensis]
MLRDFVTDIRNVYERINRGEEPSLHVFKEKWNIKRSIGEVYQNLCYKELKKQMGSFYTPHEIVDFMVKRALEDVSLKENPYIRIADPSCGGGYFLISLFEHLVQKGRDEGLANVEEHVLQNNLYGSDIDENAVMITALELYDRTGYVFKNIDKKDFLLDSKEKYDIIIGNPPYMGHKVLTGSYREELYRLYGEVFSDKGDISYCFIKKSIDSLEDGGKLLFFTSRYLLEALNGEKLRRYIKKSGTISTLIDFYGVRVIKGAGVDNMIMEFIKDEQGEKTHYFRLMEEAKGRGEEVFRDIKSWENIYSRHISVDMQRMRDDRWMFLDELEESILNKIKGVELNTLCEGYQGIITGCDDAFVLKVDEAEALGIERDVLRPWIKNKNVEAFNVQPSDEVIIYSDLICCEEKYKNAISYIERFRDRLERRRECINGRRKWYELQWGRRPELFDDLKIIYPFKASRNRFALDRGSYFSADVYAIKIRDMFINTISYEFLLGILNSRIYEFYIKIMAKKLGDDIYEYYPNKIMTLKIPEYIPELEKEVIKKGDDLRDRLDSVLNKYFGITGEEYEIIKGWCK